MPNGKCSLCGKLAPQVSTNNVLVAAPCEGCLNRFFDASKLSHANFFCRTMNFPFDPNRWQALYEQAGNHVWSAYAEEVLNEPDTLKWQPATPDKWAPVDAEWEKYKTYEALLAKVDRVRDAFIARCEVKWGSGYTFAQLVQLEGLLTSTMKANDISNPLQVDAIKKACKISVELDKAIEAGDAKSIKELSSAYSGFTKTAQIDNVIAATNADVIGTVADLADYIEKCGGRFTFYDGVSRDVVDKTIADLKEYIRVLVADSTGLTTTLERIAESYQKQVEENADAAATADLDIKELIENNEAASNAQLDAQLLQQEVDVDDLEEDDDNGYF